MIRLALGLALFAAASSCKTSAVPTATLSEAESDKSVGKLGMNDVSILMPILSRPEIVEDLPKIGDIPNPSRYAEGQPFAKEDGQPFVPLSVWAQIKDLLEKNRKEISAAFEKGDAEEFVQDSGFNDIQENQLSSFTERGNTFADDFRMVALRLDPCVNIIDAKGDDAKCVRQLRLSFQPVRKSDKNGVGVIDFNIHAAYALSREEFGEILSTMRKLRATGDAQDLSLALQPHPVIAKEGKDGLYFRTVLGVVHRYARAMKLTNLAFLADTAPGLQGHWPMVTALVQNNQASFIDIPFVQKSAKVETFAKVQRMNGRGINLEAPIPASKSAVNFYTDDRKQNVKRTFMAENPKINDALRSDCAACHTAMQERAANAFFMKRENKTPLVAREMFTSKRWNLSNVTAKPTEGLDPAFGAFPDGTSLQMFAYFLGKAKIAQRTINETADVLDYIEEKY